MRTSERMGPFFPLSDLSTRSVRLLLRSIREAQVFVVDFPLTLQPRGVDKSNPTPRRAVCCPLPPQQWLAVVEIGVVELLIVMVAAVFYSSIQMRL